VLTLCESWFIRVYRILEYLTRDDAERAVKELDGRDLRGRPVRVALDDYVSFRSTFLGPMADRTQKRGGADNYRRDDRRDERPRDDRNRDDRYREDRSTYRRDRSRSPPRRAEYEDRRPRSPPPRREVDDRRPAGYDDYRRGGYDERRGPDYYVDRRRDDIDRRRDDRRRDDKDERFDDRPPRHANGDGGWTR
jgi:splicing factor, arginine/serine-rich 4/5/6